MGPMEWFLLITLSVLWGGSFFFVGVIVEALPPLTIVVLRVGLAALALNIALLAIGRPIPGGARLWMAFLGMGFLNNVIPFCLIVWGQTHIASGLASILNATTPLFTVIVAHFLTRDERMTAAKFAGVIAGLIGVAIMMGPDALQGFSAGLLAQLAIIGAAMSYAFAGIFGRRFHSLGVAPVHTAAGQLTASTVLLMPVVLLVDRPWALPLPGADIWAAVAGLALLSTALAYILFFRILATAGATNLLLVTFLIPVSAVLLGSGILGEQLEARHFAGMAMIGLGLAAIDGRPFQRTADRP
ncbi:MAG: DMT family transporter [Gammaproteobacteria bacterium]